VYTCLEDLIEFFETFYLNDLDSLSDSDYFNNFFTDVFIIQAALLTFIAFFYFIFSVILN
jgi:hypothetical protein